MKNILKKRITHWFLLFLFTLLSGSNVQAQWLESAIKHAWDETEAGTNSSWGFDEDGKAVENEFTDLFPGFTDEQIEALLSGGGGFGIPLDTVTVKGESHTAAAVSYPEFTDQYPIETPGDFTDSNPPTISPNGVDPDPKYPCSMAIVCGKYLVLDLAICGCVPTERPWYLDKDGDGWHNKDEPVKTQIESPGSDWIKKTSGTDCDDDNPSVTTNCYKNYYIDNDNDGWDSGIISALNDNGGKYKTTSNGKDCDDSPTTGAKVHKLNKCGKCEAEPVSGSCDRDCIENNTSNPMNIKPSEAKLSQNAINLLKGIETLSLVPYDDATGKPITKYVDGATIGYGHLITSVAEFEIYKNGISATAANTLFTNDINREIKSVRKLSDDLSQNQFDALAIMVFNIGTQFNSSSLRKFLEDCNAKTNYSSVENAWKAFNKDNGVLLQGLINRRNCEWDIFVNGIYKQW